MIVGWRPSRCQCTARQLASVLLPLPPFMVATVMIVLILIRPLPQQRRIIRIDVIGFLANCLLFDYGRQQSSMLFEQ